ncbi:hypothetical protein D3C72_1599570 [compost metagenome]
MHVLRAHALAREVHVFVVVAVAAFQRIVRLEARPFVLGQFQPFVDEFFARVDGAEDLAPDFLGRLHLARDLVRPVVRHVAVRTQRAHARTVGEVDGALQFRIDVVAHFMAAGAELFGVGELHRGVEGAPEQDAADEAAYRQKAQAEMHAGAADDVPVAL